MTSVLFYEGVEEDSPRVNVVPLQCSWAALSDEPWSGTQQAAHYQRHQLRFA